MKDSRIDGIYAAYFTGIYGNSLGLFLFKDGVIAGTDIGGAIYDGTFSLTKDQEYIIGTVRCILPIGSSSITGVSASSEPIVFEAPIQLPKQFYGDDIHRIETQTGPINVKFKKLRGL